MTKKKLEEEIKDSENKTKQIKEEIDVNEINEEAETIKNVTFIIWDKE